MVVFIEKFEPECSSAEKKPYSVKKDNFLECLLELLHLLIAHNFSKLESILAPRICILNTDKVPYPEYGPGYPFRIRIRNSALGYIFIIYLCLKVLFVIN